MRTPFIAGNWKMNLNEEQAIKLVGDLQENLQGIDPSKVTVAVCPVSLHLATICRYLKENAGSVLVAVGAQNMHWEVSGAFTGEISGKMLEETGCRYVILGHSERRHLMGETDEMVAKKARSAFEYGLLPIVCVGETLEQRESSKTIEVVKHQVEKGLELLAEAQIEATTIAYEPVWAIGTGKAATPEMAQEVHAMIRETLTTKYGKAIAENVRIQYGGSVKPSNVDELISQQDIDGALVGGASLKADSFAALVKSAAGAQK